MENLQELLRDCKSELKNLCEKIAHGEQEGWEGSKRRARLHYRIDETLTELRGINEIR
jgi:hypothetical protein